MLFISGDSVVVYQLQQEVAEVAPHPVRLWSIGVRKVNQVQEQALVDVKVLRITMVKCIVRLSTDASWFHHKQGDYRYQTLTFDTFKDLFEISFTEFKTEESIAG